VILPDVNLLVYSVDESSPFHVATRHWWDQALSSSDAVGLCYPSLLGFVRLSTSRVVFRSPLAIDRALSIAESWMSQPNVSLLLPTSRHWPILGELLGSATAGGNLTTDAHIAAHAIEHGYTLYSTDGDFGRFSGLRWKNPLA
jgi:toxin-antitoxin system PIN domain toxin